MWNSCVLCVFAHGLVSSLWIPCILLAWIIVLCIRNKYELHFFTCHHALTFLLAPTLNLWCKRIVPGARGYILHIYSYHHLNIEAFLPNRNWGRQQDESLLSVQGTTSLLRESEEVSSHRNIVSVNKAYLWLWIGCCGGWSSLCNHVSHCVAAFLACESGFWSWSKRLGMVSFSRVRTRTSISEKSLLR